MLMIINKYLLEVKRDFQGDSLHLLPFRATSLTKPKHLSAGAVLPRSTHRSTRLASAAGKHRISVKRDSWILTEGCSRVSASPEHNAVTRLGIDYG